MLLVIDDEPALFGMVARVAQAQGFDIITRAGGHATIAELPTLSPDVALVDLQMPEVGGLDVMRAIRDALPACQVILMTGHASLDSALEAVKLGALDYLGKPFSVERLGVLLATVRDGIARREQLLVADTDLAGRFELCGLIGRSPVMQELFDTMRRLAPHVRTALVTGETGTGKELAARALHRLGSRRNRPYVALNCSAIVETLFESELFGHTRGAFTGASEAKTGLFERAAGGTLFLDEIGELPLPLQPKLLRALEYGEIQRVGASAPMHVDVHVIAATNRNLGAESAAGRFRQDLYYRLDVVEFKLPPLREHRDDIPYLTAAFVNDFAKRFGKALAGVSPGAERLLQSAPWPGNVRQLRNVLERACLASDTRMLTERDVVSALGDSQPAPTLAAAANTPGAGAKPAAPAAPELDRRQIEDALQRVGGNRSAAARLLGISRAALYRRLDAFGLHR